MWIVMLLMELQELPKRALWLLCGADGAPLPYREMLDTLHRIYQRAGVAVPVSEDGKTMPWHSLRHTFGTECAKRGVPLRYVTVTSEDRRSAIRRAFGAERATGGQQDSAY